MTLNKLNRFPGLTSFSDFSGDIEELLCKIPDATMIISSSSVALESVRAACVMEVSFSKSMRMGVVFGLSRWVTDRDRAKTRSTEGDLDRALTRASPIPPEAPMTATFKFWRNEEPNRKSLFVGTITVIGFTG